MSNENNKQVKPKSKPPINKTVPKRTPVAKPKENTTKSKEVLKQEIVKKMETDFSKKRVPKGKTFYLIFAIIFYVAAFFYINNSLFDNEDYLQSGLFAFAALFVAFVLLQFNVHMLIVNFFRLPLLLLIRNASIEIQTRKETSFSFGKYKGTLSLVLYTMFGALIVGSNIYNSILNETAILSMVTQSFVILFVYLIILCSWQYLFNIIPNILEKSIDAKNGFVLTLSAAVMILFVLFQIFDIHYLSQVMIFILIVGFIALLGVNLNMIVGEINIFQNIRQKHNKTVSRVVFSIFFSFHLYVIVYASVVAYSIYLWEPETYNFNNFEIVTEETEQLYNMVNGEAELVTEILDQYGQPVTTVYDMTGTEITEFFDDDNNPVYYYEGTQLFNTGLYDVNGNSIEFTDQNNMFLNMVSTKDGESITAFYFDDGALYGYYEKVMPHTYGDFLYYTVVTTSTLGYGDITPNLNYNIAQFWGAFLSVYGFTFFALSISFVSNIAIEGATRKEVEKND